MALRRQLGVTSFGINQIVLQPGQRGRIHRHERQEEVYLVLDGEIEFRLGEGEGETVTLGRGGVVRVAPATVRSLRNTATDAEAVYFAVGAQGGYVGRDGRQPEGETGR